MRGHLLFRFLLVAVVMTSCWPRPDPNPDPPVDPKPAAPSHLKYTSMSVSEVELEWKDNSDNEEGFRVLRGGQLLTTTQRNSYTDGTVQPGTTYRYQIEAFNAYGKSISNQLTLTTPANASAPKAPSNIAAKSDFHQVTLTWKDNANNETKYVVKRADLDEIKLDQNTTKYVDQNLEHNKTYSYQVYAVNAAGKSGIASIDATTRGSFVVRWNRAKDRKEVDGQLVENGWAESYELTVAPQDGSSPFMAYSGADTVFTVVIDKPFCASVVAIDGKENKSAASKKACSQ